MIPAEMIKERVTVPMLLNHYGVRIRGGRCACPIHHGKDANMAVKDRWFRCFRCGASGTVIDLQMALSGSDFGCAVRELDALFGLKLEPKKPSEALRARLAVAGHKKAKLDSERNNIRNSEQYSLLCDLRRWLAMWERDTTALDKYLDYYQSYTGADTLPDALHAADMLGLRNDMEVMMLAADAGFAAANDDG